jgi:hypothetical protein
VAAPPAHLEALPLQRDGTLNKQFRQELVLGSDTNNVQVDANGIAQHHDDHEGKDIDTIIDELMQRYVPTRTLRADTARAGRTRTVTNC